MNTTLSAENLLEKRGENPLVDVRSPAEFRRGHIPGAINLPLFDDEERARVGTTYKKSGHDAAVRVGLEVMGPKLLDWVQGVDKLDHNRATPIYLYCWRGGMRSNSAAWLLETAGYKPLRLAGGYKSYRKLVQRAFSKARSLCVIGGKTGAGKTELLHELSRLGEQVIDLEQLAHHRGSSFGAVNMPTQPKTEHFENKLYTQLRAMDPARRTWLEDESQGIGRVFIPPAFFDIMHAAPVFLIDVPREKRVERLVKYYADAPRDALSEAILRLKRRLGGLRVKNALAALERGDFAEVAATCLAYYDKTYAYGFERRNPQVVARIEWRDHSLTEIARKLMEADG